MDDAAPTAIEYQFTDASVPPQYHRSWTLRVDPMTARITVDSYGDALAERETALPDGLWQRLTANLPAEQSPAGPADGCTGGTSMAVRVSSDDRVLLDRSGDNCGGVNTMDDVATWIAPARDLFPPMEQLAPEDSQVSD